MGDFAPMDGPKWALSGYSAVYMDIQNSTAVHAANKLSQAHNITHSTSDCGEAIEPSVCLIRYNLLHGADQEISSGVHFMYSHDINDGDPP